MSEDKNLGNSELNAADELTNAPQEQQPVEYTDDNIRHLSDMEHVRTRPGMYIGRLGDGNLPEDGIYVLLKGEGGQCPQFPLRSKVVPRRKGAPSEV